MNWLPSAPPWIVFPAAVVGFLLIWWDVRHGRRLAHHIQRNHVELPVVGERHEPANLDKEKSKRNTLIYDGRKIVARFMELPDMKSDRLFINILEVSLVYYELRPYLSNSYKQKLACSGRTAYAQAKGASLPYFASEFLAEMERIEKEWGLRGEL